MTDAEIRDELRDLGYNDDLSDGSIDTAIAHVIRDLKYDYPLQTYGAFNLVADQQIYDLFSAVPDVPTSKGVLPGGIRALEIVWSPSGCDDFGGAGIFGIGPWLSGLTVGFGEISSFSFQTPGDFLLWDLNWSAFVERFGSLFFEHVNAQPGSPVRLYPVPGGTGSAYVKYLKYRTEDELRNEDESTFLMFVQAECASALGRFYACSAGTTFGGAKDDGKTAEYWRREAERLLAQARDQFHAHLYTGFSAADRT